MTHTPTLRQRFAAGAAATLMMAALIGGAPMIASASTMKMAKHHTMASQKTVYVCNKCHEYWSPATAKKMHYIDGMGHKMVKAHKIPKGYMNGSKMGAM